MLVLARQKDQSIVIGDDVVITIVDIRGDKVRLGINAPREVSVHRKEIYDLVREKASQPTPAPDEATLGFMRAAVEEAQAGLHEGGLPIGSVLVRNGQVIARGHNRRVQNGNPMAHAEIDCLTNAGRQDTYKDTILFSTLSPCHLCSGAAVQFGIPKVVIGESVNFPGAPDHLRKHGIEVVDLHDAQCIAMMSDFIKANPKLWHEDIGK